MSKACPDCEPSSEANAEPSLGGLATEVARIFVGKKAGHSVEREMLKLSAWTFIALLILGAIGYWGFFGRTPDFLARYGLLLFYLLVGMVAVSATVWHLKAYRGVSCETGMMAGMTVGMLSGFLVGLIIGITNGMFVGSVAGMLIGIFLGSWCGKCCGIMGVMEGQMAGFMAGTMGAMTSIMMLNDNYLLYIPIALVFIVVILAGLMFLLYKENAAKNLSTAKKTAREDFMLFLSVNFIILLALAVLMLYGPKSALVLVPLG